MSDMLHEKRIWLRNDDEVRLSKLAERLDISKSEVIAQALKLYETILEPGLETKIPMINIVESRMDPDRARYLYGEWTVGKDGVKSDE